jgi:hypothetical protein
MNATLGSFLETMFKANQIKAMLDAIRRCASLSYSYDPTTAAAQERAMGTLIHTHVAFQRVKPTRWFRKYWFRTDDAGHIESMSNDLGMIHLDNPVALISGISSTTRSRHKMLNQ